MFESADPNTPMTLVGMVVQTEGSPSFGTPIFANSDYDYRFIQSSREGKLIDEFIAVRGIADNSKLYKVLGLNSPYFIGMPFMFGLVDYKRNASAMRRGDIYKKLLAEFNEYNDYPFFQWTIVSLFNSEKMLKKIDPQILSFLVSEFDFSSSINKINSVRLQEISDIHISSKTKNSANLIKLNRRKGIISTKIAHSAGGIRSREFISRLLVPGKHDVSANFSSNDSLLLASYTRNLKILRKRLKSSKINT